MATGIGLRFKANGSPEDGALLANSWGTLWVSGPRWPDDMPDGCFWVTRRDIEAILSQGDSFAVGGVSGFVWRDIDNHNWQQLAPPDAPPPPPLPPSASVLVESDR